MGPECWTPYSTMTMTILKLSHLTRHPASSASPMLPAIQFDSDLGKSTAFKFSRYVTVCIFVSMVRPDVGVIKGDRGRDVDSCECLLHLAFELDGRPAANSFLPVSSNIRCA